MKRIEYFYPNFSRKALSFTIDDGNMKYDAILLDILKPAGIKGTFNLCSNLHEGREAETVEFYRGYDIANHCKYHPLVNLDGENLVISDDQFDANTSDPRFLYRVDGNDRFYWQMQRNGWRQLTFEDDYIAFVKDGLSELNALFGEGTVKDFVWPYGERKNAKVFEFVKSMHRSVRKSGCTLDSTGFAIPADKYAWNYNANHTNLLEVMEKYEAYPDDGELKFFAFGVHAIDYENDQKWDDLRTFATKYGNRPDTYWYASVGELFDYEEAIAEVTITDFTVENHSDKAVYMAIDGKRTILEAGAEISI